MINYILGGGLLAGVGLLVLFWRATKGDKDIYIVSADTLKDIRTGRTGRW